MTLIRVMARPEQPARAVRALPVRMLCLAFLALITSVLMLPAEAATRDAQWERLLQQEQERHEERWAFLRGTHFGDKPVGDAAGILEISAPVVPRDPSVVPVSIKALLPQTGARYISKITLLVDHNPSPLAAVFYLSPSNGVADIATRVRVGEFSHVRAVAEFNDGALVMASSFVKASGGCDVVPFEDPTLVEERLGTMKLRLPGGTMGASEVRTGTRFADLLIDHPNYNGMQASDTPGVMIPLRTLDKVEVKYGGEPLIRIEGHLSLSHNPRFRFHYLPRSASDEGNGEGFSVRMLDSANAQFERNWPTRNKNE